jgi:hypothetical protein
VVVTVGSLLAIPRESRSTTFSDLFSSNAEAQKDYAKGLIALGSFILVVAVVWFLILVVLRLKGKDIGCASGIGFEIEPPTEPSNSRPSENNNRASYQTRPAVRHSGDTYKGEDLSDEFKRSPFATTGLDKVEYLRQKQDFVEARYSPKVTKLAVKRYPSTRPQRDYVDDVHSPDPSNLAVMRYPSTRQSHTGGQRPTPESYLEQDDFSMDTKDLDAIISSANTICPPRQADDDFESGYLPKSNAVPAIDPQQRDRMNELLYSLGKTPKEIHAWSSPHRRQLRQRRTRNAFGFFSAMTIVCSVLLFGYTYFPFRKATHEISKVLSDGHEIVNTIQKALSTILDAGANAQAIIDNDLPLDYDIMCPDVVPERFDEVLGVDPRSVVTFVTNDFDGIKVNALSNITSFESVISDVDAALSNLETSILKADRSLWMLPLTVALLIILTLFSLLGVVGAESGRSTPYFQRLQGCVVLPLLVLLTVFCWIYLLGSSIGTVITYDICTADSPTPPGSPENTIQSIFMAQNIRPGSDIYDLVTEYTTGCRGEDPIQALVDLDLLVSYNIEVIQQHLSEADAVGHSALRERCGEGNEIDQFFWGVRLLEAHLLSVRDALHTSAEVLACPRLNSLYRRVFHEAICTNVASANASGFVLFMMLTIANMSLITLRSAWRRYAPAVLEPVDVNRANV